MISGHGLEVGGGGIGPRAGVHKHNSWGLYDRYSAADRCFVLGAILVARQREGHGIWAMVVSPAALAIANAL